MAKQKQQTVPKVEQLDEYVSKYSDVNAEVIVKADLQIQGMKFTPAALEAAKGAQTKSYYLFSFDRTKVQDMAPGESAKVPEEIKVRGGRYHLRTTLQQVRINKDSPYTVDVVDGKVKLCIDGVDLGDVEYPKPPASYGLRLSDGSSCAEIAPVLGWGYLVFVTCLRNCQYWGDQEECRFCDINSNVRQQQQAGREYTIYKKVEQVAEALEKVFVTHRSPPELAPQVFLLSGGTVTKNVQGKDDTEFYLEYVRAIRERIGHRALCILQTAAKTKKDCQRMKDAGVDIHHANMELWDKILFQALCPGKERFVGYDEWVKRLIESVEVFGPGNVCPNFVCGVEMAQPLGFKEVDAAVESTLSGWDILMQHGVVPRITPWCVEPMSPLGGQPPPPLDYHIKIIKGWHELITKYRLYYPHGLGPFGVGRSIFPTSAYFDLDVGQLQRTQ